MHFDPCPRLPFNRSSRTRSSSVLGRLLPFAVLALALFRPALGWAETGQVAIDRIEPWYGAPWPDGSTSRTPSVVAVLTDELGEGLGEVDLLVDGEYWATWLEGLGSADWARGDTEATIRRDTEDPTRFLLEYRHSSYPRDWLGLGDHELFIRFQTAGGKQVELPADADWARFRVDNKASSIH